MIIITTKKPGSKATKYSFNTLSEAKKFMDALLLNEQLRVAEQSVQADLLESCDCDRSSLHDCVCPQCHARYIASR